MLTSKEQQQEPIESHEHDKKNIIFCENLTDSKIEGAAWSKLYERMKGKVSNEKK